MRIVHGDAIVGKVLLIAEVLALGAT